jgi:molecular chaperone DnaK (HSP70)
LSGDIFATKSEGNRITPSYVAWDGEERLVGDAAKNQATINPAATVFDAKRLIGRQFTDTTVQADMKLWPWLILFALAFVMFEWFIYNRKVYV